MGEINFTHILYIIIYDIFHLTQYIQNIISTCNQHIKYHWWNSHSLDFILSLKNRCIVFLNDTLIGISHIANADANDCCGASFNGDDQLLGQTAFWLRPTSSGFKSNPFLYGLLLAADPGPTGAVGRQGQ